MFIETKIGDIINTDRIEKITYDKRFDNKWVLTIAFNVRSSLQIIFTAALNSVDMYPFIRYN